MEQEPHSPLQEANSLFYSSLLQSITTSDLKRIEEKRSILEHFFEEARKRRIAAAKGG